MSTSEHAGLEAMYRAAARINRAIMRADTPDGAYASACRHAVESGLFEHAWVLQLDVTSGRLRPVARAGNAPAPLLERICAPPDAGERASPAWTALRAGKAAAANDLARDTEPWPGRAEALASGLNAVASLPFREPGGAACVFELWAAMAGRFDERLLALLGEIVEDLGFALGHIIHDQQQGLAAATRVHYLAYYNPQTGLPNRTLLEQRMRQVAANMPSVSFSLFSIRLRRLEAVARVFGSAAVEELLRALAERLERACREIASAAIVSHAAQDEFAVAIPEVTERDAIAAIGRTLMRTLTRPLDACGGVEVSAGACIGVARLPLDEPRLDRLLSRARTAAAHALPNGDVQFYDAAFDRESVARLSLEAELHRALERGEFDLAFQPQLSLRSGAMVGVEALLRWRHPTRGVLLPATFVPALEACGLMTRVGEWVLRAACAQNRAWLAAGLPRLRMSVNVSAQQLRNDALLEAVHDVMREDAATGRLLELELTEGLVLDDTQHAIAVMQQLKRLGVTLSLDDFGTGYSALGYLRRLPVDRIKIDQCFVRDLATDPGSATLVRAILAMAASLCMSTVAEGVEQLSQLGYLRRHGCHEMQGFLFSAPLPAADLALMLRQDLKLPVTDPEAEPQRASVLVVDDEPGVLAALKRVLRTDGIDVLAAPGPLEALELLATTNVGVIVCDQRMRGMTGAEFLGLVRGIYPQSIRILLTGHADVASLLEAVNRGAVSKVLTKPWEDDQLRANVGEALRHYMAADENRRLGERLERIRREYPNADEDARARLN